jgi:uncharacterized integral membrane protein (TIGR00697 family)
MAMETAPPLETQDQVAPFLRLDGAHKLFVVLSAVFVACLLLGDVIGGKFVATPLGAVSVGMIPFPVTFLLTDVVNDFYGRRGARFLTWLGFWMAVLAWTILQLSTALRPHETTYFKQAEFAKIFGGSAKLFTASMMAYLIGQFLDIRVFQYWKALTQSRHLWLRATGSTVLSQIVDTVTINLVFVNWSVAADPTSELSALGAQDLQVWIWKKIGREYGIKLVIALLLTPAVYAVHGAIVRWFRIQPEAHEPGSR